MILFKILIIKWHFTNYWALRSRNHVCLVRCEPQTQLGLNKYFWTKNESICLGAQKRKLLSLDLEGPRKAVQRWRYLRWVESWKMHRWLPCEQALAQFSQSDCPQSWQDSYPSLLPKAFLQWWKKPRALLDGGHLSRNFQIKIQVLLCLHHRERGRWVICMAHHHPVLREVKTLIPTDQEETRERPSTGESSFGIRRKSEVAHCQVALRNR